MGLQRMSWYVSMNNSKTNKQNNYSPPKTTPTKNIKTNNSLSLTPLNKNKTDSKITLFKSHSIKKLKL